MASFRRHSHHISGGLRCCVLWYNAVECPMHLRISTVSYLAIVVHFRMCLECPFSPIFLHFPPFSPIFPPFFHLSHFSAGVRVLRDFRMRIPRRPVHYLQYAAHSAQHHRPYTTDHTPQSIWHPAQCTAQHVYVLHGIACPTLVQLQPPIPLPPVCSQSLNIFCIFFQKSPLLCTEAFLLICACSTSRGTFASYFVETKRWMQPKTEGPLPSKRYRHTSVIHEDHMFVFGGMLCASALSPQWCCCFAGNG